MDRERFDALTRLLGKEGTRRGAVGALLGAAILGTAHDATMAVSKKKKRKRRRKAARRRQQNLAASPPPPPAPCFGIQGCVYPSPGNDFQSCLFPFINIEECGGCNFRAADLAFVDADFANLQGNSFRNANLRGAQLSFADVSGASFRDACLTGADFFGANIDGAHFENAVFCNTVGTDGQINNSGCVLDLNACCPPCLAPGAGCGPGTVGSCCNGACVAGVCQPECQNDAQCAGKGDRQFCNNFVCRSYCLTDAQCGGAPDVCFQGQCLEPQCAINADCADNGLNSTCCGVICRDLQNDRDNCGSCGHRCFPGHVCALGNCIDPTPFT